MTLGPMKWIEPPTEGRSLEEIIEDFVWHVYDLIWAIIRRDWTNLPTYRGRARRDLEEVWRRVEGYANKVGNAVADWVSGLLTDIAIGIGNAYSIGEKAWDWAKLKGSQLWTWFVDWSAPVRDWIRDKSGWVWDWVVAWSNIVTAWVRDKGGPVWDWISAKAGVVWDWIASKSGWVWDWIRDFSDPVWKWITQVGAMIYGWWVRLWWPLSDWVFIFMDYYTDLFKKHGNDLLDFLDSPVMFLLDRVLLSAIEHWLYNHWFSEMQ